MVVRKIDPQLAALRPAAGIGRRVRFHEIGPRIGDAAARADTRDVAVEPLVADRVGRRHEHGARLGTPQDSRDAGRTGDLPGRAAPRILEGRRYEAAVDQDRAALIEAERGQHVVALEGAARHLAGREPVHQRLRLVLEPAGDPDAAELVALRAPGVRSGEGRRRLDLRARQNARDQCLLLGLAAKLPSAEAEQDRQTQERDEAGREQAAPGTGSNRRH